MFDPGAAYGRARVRVEALLHGLSPTDEARPVPSCPGWDVHDLVAHVVGVVDDARAGNMAGVATDPWTAAHVARGRGEPLAALLARWQAASPTFETALATVPLGAMAAIDLLAHEHDLRGALDLAGARDHPDVVLAARDLARGRLSALGPDVRIELGGALVCGAPDAPVVLRASSWELFRAVLGRRSPGQLAALVGGSIEPARVAQLVVFGPAARDLVE